MNIKLYQRRFEKIEKLGEGTYGKVYKVCIRGDQKETIYALKKYDKKYFGDGMDITALREITILKEINHDNIVKIIDMFYGANSLFVAYEYLDYDLSHIFYNSEIPLTEGVIKGLMKQLLTGLYELHRFNVIHRDLKPQNLLIKKNGLLKIADFGFARFIASPGREMTTGVISDWYRPPEIFFGAKFYSYEVDIWSAGCIFAEFLQKQPIFCGNGEIDILTKIFLLLGVPNDSVWPGVMQLEGFKLFTKGDIEPIQSKFEFASKEARDLLEKMLVLNPNNRISAEESLNHPYFSIDPLPATSEEIAELLGR